MKKKNIVIAFTCVMAITNLPVNHISANTNPVENDKYFEINIPEDEVRENFNIYGFNGEEDYQTELLKFLGKRQKYEITVARVFTITTTSCYTIQAIYNFDPCAWAIKNIWNGLKKPPKGKYKVMRKFIKGRFPNCQPMYSYQYNVGYWKYSFQKIK